jgi:hypothetical protein
MHRLLPQIDRHRAIGGVLKTKLLDCNMIAESFVDGTSVP